MNEKEPGSQGRKAPLKLGTRARLHLLLAGLSLLLIRALLTSPSALAKVSVDPETGEYMHPPFREKQCLRCHDEATRIPKTQPTVASLCYTCHTSKSDNKYVHGPVGAGSCTQCHTPHASPNEYLLKKPVEEICYTCHPNFETEETKSVHPPVRKRECTKCHSPHSTPYRYQLYRERGPLLCFTCHDQKKIMGVSTPHPPVRDGKCLECHTPHASTYPKIARESPSGPLCFTCHQDKKALMTGKRFVHLPVKQDCRNCHNPMGSNNPKILRSSYDFIPSAPFSAKRFELCFTCHRMDKYLEPQNPATEFRNGKANLHYTHVNSSKGLNCLLCHDVHASSNPALVRDEPWPAAKNTENSHNGARRSFEFKKTLSGGSCTGLCHQETLTYNRAAGGL